MDILLYLLSFLTLYFVVKYAVLEALHQFKSEVVQEIKEQRHFKGKYTSRDILEVVKSELLQELCENNRKTESNTEEKR